ncbi:LexA family transcriptional regulator [Escherichia coli]|uniref:LexA family protein n=1 Tax=Escherichia coli TaxID=562 RepID=UPI00180E1ACA|nr:LexA family transcriptional regulator [Escherichia coli]EFE6859271.1 LexA family transcriptional regulator [Escherichia coli]EGB2408939.1 LexA family transcriptional regulator [Escherichia coli]MCB4483548.1 LexA family transcriptional regulator [Escherichia coli]CAK0703050.1 LexA family transcriptional regulator [Escherichia coli]HDD9043201.1 LexA family transcriptional regulator [Escherichia coli]
MEQLTTRQEEVLGLIENYQQRMGFPPTVYELANLMGCNSGNAAALHIKALEKKGYISVARGAARGITILRAGEESEAVKIVRALLEFDADARQKAMSWLKAQGVTL